MKKRFYYRTGDGKLHWTPAFDPPITLSLRKSRELIRKYQTADGRWRVRYRCEPMSTSPRAK